jgi:hypothetical protein
MFFELTPSGMVLFSNFNSYSNQILDLTSSIPSSIATQNFVDTSGQYPFSLLIGDTSFYSVNLQINLAVLSQSVKNGVPAIVSGTYQIVCQYDSFHSKIYDIITSNSSLTITGTFKNLPNN